ncbi:transcriptional activator NhaR [Uliginosibacterium sediminicola]|uniref:Transcriptional activator NhaR n=1 Tax=Uliginosibacterium sediminicola TaxID=2024550 RepID=A0ABU9YYL6_9RHOO
MNYKHLHYFWTIAKAGSMARASEKLHITPQTLSGQIKLLEDRLGKALFRKSGRKLELTDAGKIALAYADDIFTLGAELESALRNDTPQGLAIEFRVGIADSVPKSVAYRLLEPATQLPEAVKLVCREWKLDNLLSELAMHRLDLVLSDKPVPPGLRVKVFNHPLGKSGLSFFAARSLRKQSRKAFPACLNDLPLLCMGDDAALWGDFQAWLEKHGLHPRVLGEFDDGALMKAFGREARGVFASPSVLEAETCAQYGVEVIGRSNELSQAFYAISAERRISHPCVVAITSAAREELFLPG